MVDFKQIDRAYVQYMISCDILVHLIPRHRDFPSMSNDSRDWYRSYISIRRVSLRFLPAYSPWSRGSSDLDGPRYFGLHADSSMSSK